MIFKVFRYSKENNKSYYDTFEVPNKSDMSVLGALFYIQDHLDDSLSFRYSCRGAVCGTCAMLINKVPRLACRIQVNKLLNGISSVDLVNYPALENKLDWKEDKQILIEPLPHLPIIKDLIVNMDNFFKAWKKIEPLFKTDKTPPKKEYIMDPKNAHQLETYTNCILCGSCYGACPVNSENKNYLGPAALAKLYRLYIDSRETNKIKRLLTANNKDGWWGCEFHTNCTMVCPKGVTPNIGIGKARSELLKIGKKPI
jgi:succinate dehydrogenase / fumarate reductase iron-sulfur subunit